MRWFPRLPKRELLVVAGISLVAFVTTLGILEARAGSRARRLAASERQELERRQKPPALGPEELALTAEDFLLPQLGTAEKAMRYEPFRPPLQRWSPQMVGRFWIAPREIAAEILGSANDASMRHLFESVP